MRVIFNKGVTLFLLTRSLIKQSKRGEMKKKLYYVLGPLATVIAANLIGIVPTFAQDIQENIEIFAESSIAEEQAGVLRKSQQNLTIQSIPQAEKTVFIADSSAAQANNIFTTSSLETDNFSVNVFAANNNQPMAQVTSVSQLSDVQPTDWAFQALQSLVERYGCIAGYPDSTYRGNRALTRYEFAAGLNACLDRVNRALAKG